MPLYTTSINGITVDVYYKYEKCRDAFGTGDSPTYHDLEIIAIESPSDTVNLMPIIDLAYIEEIENEIIQMEGE